MYITEKGACHLMEKVFEMHRKRVISTLQAVKQYPNLVVYLDEEFIDGQKVSSTQGLASLQAIQSIGKNEPVKDFEKSYEGRAGKSKKGVMMARRETMREELRKKGMAGSEWKHLGTVDNPYDVIQSVGTLDMDNPGEYEVFYLHFANHIVEGMDEKPVPQGLKFDYMGSCGQLDDGLYELERILEVIKDRSDIEWLNEEEVAKITRIPYYNAERNRTSQLEFRWIPSDADYEKIQGEPTSWDRNLRHVVMEKVFGIDLYACRRMYTAEELEEDDED